MADATATLAINPKSIIVNTRMIPAATPINPPVNPAANPAKYNLKNLLAGVKYLSLG